MEAGMAHPDVTVRNLAADLAKITDVHLRSRLACHFCSLLLTGRFCKADHLEFAETKSAEAAAAIAVGTPYEAALKNMSSITEINLMRSQTWDDRMKLADMLKVHEETLTALDKANKRRMYEEKQAGPAN